MHPTKREIDLISQAGLRAAALTKKLLTFSRRQVFEPKELDINASVRDMEDLLQRMIGEHAQMVVVLHPAAGHAMMDPVQLQQILMNLAVNVCDAMPDGGLVNIETDRIDLDKQFVRLHPGAMTDSFVKILVQDAGCGMNPETLSHIFKPFFTTKGPDKGIGPGLATVYGILKQSQGYIDVISQPGQGTRFTVYLPRVGQPGAVLPVIQTAMTPVTARETILLVEDDDSIQHADCRRRNPSPAATPTAQRPLSSSGNRRYHAPHEEYGTGRRRESDAPGGSDPLYVRLRGRDAGGQRDSRRHAFSLKTVPLYHADREGAGDFTEHYTAMSKTITSTSAGIFVLLHIR
ncbi:MAG: ATP-binding protein [Nitrospirota bacterium]